MKNPWLSIWTCPRVTIAQIVAENKTRSFWSLSFIYGFSSLLNLFQSASVGEFLGTLSILGLVIVLAPLWGYAMFTIWSAFVTWVGHWFKGQGEFGEVRAAYAWSCVPLLLNIPLWLLMIGLFGNQLFLYFPDGYAFTGGQVAILFSVLILKVVFAIWSFVIYLNALAEVQKFSILRAILNVAVAGIITGIVAAILWSLFVYAVNGAMNSAPTAFLNLGRML